MQDNYHKVRSYHNEKIHPMSSLLLQQKKKKGKCF
ncbi:hypothetical protein I7I52_02624 [Histoplasma capsulatum]|uniref:Uncharacterized protein n=1 Tax=Ajellomyces capsulatus TaxID=5037 RepID=A0A8H7ZB32_AJECA|nr:hypothetical protein I7I52_02624 [Histoplasma capsulatum]